MTELQVAPEAEVTLRDDERQRCEVWTRVMGYHRPVASFNIGKQGEFLERRYFREPAGLAGGACTAPAAASATDRGQCGRDGQHGQRD